MDSNQRSIAAQVPMMTADQLLKAPGAVVIDLRTPAEFAVDHLPGAVNVPLLSDEGRALVGLLYSQHSPEEAFSEGRELVTQRVEALVAEIAGHVGWEPPKVDLAKRVREMTAAGIAAMERDLAPEALDLDLERPVVLHCWRGGLRSRSVVALMRSLGLERAVGLFEGYRAYRARVIQELAAFQSPPAFALRGLTGVGKTLVLREIERLRPSWTIDLEGCAGHRSSLLGMVGLQPVSQKEFDTNLAARVRAGFDGPVVYEGESRKVGDVIIPGPMWAALQGATNIELTASPEVRGRVLMEDYLARPEARPKLREQLEALEARMDGTHDLPRLLDERREAELVQVLLEHYYDPLYRRSEKGKQYAASFDVQDPVLSAAEVVAWIEAQ
ncbi:MAG: tRNA 2-selenouridine synthase [Planctomycetota bacterium]|jgi:tRNA 2-selenouridine synthase